MKDIFITMVLMIILYIFSSCYYIYDQNTKEYTFNLKQCTHINLYNGLFLLHSLLFAIFGILAFYLNNYDFLALYKYFILIQFLFIIMIIDIKKKVIPNDLLIILLVLIVFIDCYQIIKRFDSDFSFALSFVLGGGIAFLIFFISMFVSRGGVGAGDVKLLTIIGLCSGYSVVDIIMYSLFCSFVCALFLLVTKRAKMKDCIPMAPFIYIGTLAFFISCFL